MAFLKIRNSHSRLASRQCLLAPKLRILRVSLINSQLLNHFRYTPREHMPSIDEECISCDLIIEGL